MFVWSRKKKGNNKPAAAAAPAGSEREVAVQKVDRINVVRNNLLVTRPPMIYGAGRRKLMRGGVPLAPAPRVGGVEVKDIDERASEYIERVRKTWYRSHKTPASGPAVLAPRSPPA